MKTTTVVKLINTVEGALGKLRDLELEIDKYRTQIAALEMAVESGISPRETKLEALVKLIYSKDGSAYDKRCQLLLDELGIEV